MTPVSSHVYSSPSIHRQDCLTASHTMCTCTNNSCGRSDLPSFGFPPLLNHVITFLPAPLFCNSTQLPDVQILAKLASGMHKPSQQTLVPMAAIPGLLQDLPIPKLRQLGGKFGDELMASLNIKTVGELCSIYVLWQLLRATSVSVP